MANVDIKLGYKDSAWFTANPTLILKQGQIVALEQTGTYKLGDGVTQLSALTFLGSSGGGSWGSITGTLSNQTDLQNALNTKEDTSNKSIDIDTDQASNTKYPSVKAIYDWVVGLFVKKGTLTTNYIPRATASDTIGNSQIFDDGNNVGIGTTSPTAKFHVEGQQSKFDYTLDGTGTGTPNMTYSTSTGGLLFNIYYPSGGGYMTKYFSNGIVLSKTTENAGYYANYVSSRYDVANIADNKLKLSVHMSNGFTAIGNDYFVPNERLEIRDGNLRINDLTPSQIVETDASKNLVSAAKGTAYNKDFGTGTTDIPEIGSTLTGSRALSTDSNGKLTPSSTTSTELGYVNGVTSAIQNQLNTKSDTVTLSTSVQFNPADATNYYFGCFLVGYSAPTSLNFRKFYINRSGTITSASVVCVRGGGTVSNEKLIFNIHVNGGAANQITNNFDLSINNPETLNKTGLNIPVSSGDYIEIGLITPTWATNPTNFAATVNLTIS